MRLASFAAACALVVLSGATSLQAQEAAEMESPEVKEITFQGVENVKESRIRESIATKETRCRSIVLSPFCWVTDSGIFKKREFLDREALRQDERRIRVFYRLHGYRDATATAEVVPDGDGVTVAFTIAEGPLTRVGSLAIEQTVPVLSERQLRAAGAPTTGDPLNLLRLDSARVTLLTNLWDEAHGDAEVRDTVRLTDSLTAAVELRLVPGPITTIGDIEIRGNERVSERTIRRTLELKTGQLFRRDELVEAQRRLYETELFRQSLVSAPEQADSAKDVVVTVLEAPFRSVRLGAGMNTVEFVQTEARYIRYNWLGGARRLDLHGAVGNLLAPQLYDRSIFGSAVPKGVLGEVDDAYLRPTWQVGADLTQPYFLGSRNSFGIGAFAQRRSLPGIVIDRGYGGDASLTRRVARGMDLSAVYRFEKTTVEAGDVYYCVNFGVCRTVTIDALRKGQKLSPFGFVGSAIRTDDPLSPSRGYTARFDLEHASALTASDFRYNRASGEMTGYLKLGSGVLAGRVNAGWVRPLAGTAEALGVEDLPGSLLHPRKRFYSGGSRSVRGYGENQLGPRILTIPASALTAPADSTRGDPCTTASILAGGCDPNVAASSEFQPRPLGGNSVLEANIEYRFPIRGALGGSVFVDAGSVGDRGLNIPTGARSAVTPGFGVRYLSPVGPVRVDLGIKPKLVEELAVMTAVVDPATGETRLIQLEREKRYDPLEDSGGALRQVLSRLQLHISIGQAF